MKLDRKRRRARFYGAIIHAVVASLGRSLRVQASGLPEEFPGGAILVGWHGRTLIGIQLFKGRRYWAMISQSLDGEMQDRIFTGFGFRTIRGSTGRGGARAAAEAIRRLREGGSLVFTPDGPRGPSRVVQDGLVLLARKSGVPVYAVGSSARRRWLAPTWDRYMVPLPFTRLFAVIGPPMTLAPDATEEEQEAFRQKVEADLNRVEQLAEAQAGHGG